MQVFFPTIGASIRPLPNRIKKGNSTRPQLAPSSAYTKLSLHQAELIIFPFSQSFNFPIFTLAFAPLLMKRILQFSFLSLFVLISFSVQGCRRGTFITRTVKYGDRSASAVRKPARRSITPGKYKVKPKKKINRSLMNR